MRRVIYGCAMSLDGYVAGPNGEYDLDRDGSLNRLCRANGQVRRAPRRTENIRRDDEGGASDDAGNEDFRILTYVETQRRRRCQHLC